ncbi:response regulator [Desulfobacterales bacterium HSG17]|nr:response regulator [Desulfobacterales bacterium HSG17]
MTKILAIDDKEDNLFTISAMIKNVIPESEMFTALSGREGIEKAKKLSPDIIILDIRMPEMDGFEVCKRLKKDEKTKHISIIMLTAAHRDSKSRIKALELGADAFLTKPIDMAEIAAQIKVVLRMRNAEKLLRKERDLLEELVAEKTRSIKQNEKRLKKSNRALKALSRCNKAIVNSTNEDELLEEACQILVDDAGYRMAWIGFALNNMQKCVRPTAQAGFEEGYLDNVKINWGDTLEGCGPTGKAVSTGKPVINNNTRTNPDFKPWQVESLRRGYASSAAIPLIINDRTEGAVNIYAEEPDAFTTEEITLLKELTDDIAHGIYMLRIQKEKKMLEYHVQQAQRKKAISTMAGGIAHNLNNILFPIIGYTEMALEDVPEGGDVHKYLKNVLTNAIQAKKLGLQMLYLSHNCNYDGQPVNVKIQQTINDTLKIIKPILPGNIKIKTSINKDCGPVLADPEQIYQIIMNLFTNACDALEGTGGEIEFILTENQISSDSWIKQLKRKPRNYIMLTISDNGCGMEKEVLNRIFDPYFTTKEIDKGKGLGLSMVRSIVSKHNGYISLDSNPGKGTVMQVYLPRFDG